MRSKKYLLNSKRQSRTLATFPTSYQFSEQSTRNNAHYCDIENVSSHHEIVQDVAVTTHQRQTMLHVLWALTRFIGHRRNVIHRFLLKKKNEFGFRSAYEYQQFLKESASNDGYLDIVCCRKVNQKQTHRKMHLFNLLRKQVNASISVFSSTNWTNMKLNPGPVMP